MKKNLIVVAVFSLLLLVGCSNAESDNSSHIEENASDLVIPTWESIVKDGYPINENGQTYGINMGDLILGELGEPDLILAKGENGTIGYVKIVDLEGPQPKTPEEAVRLNDTLPSEIPLYDVDGETIIGKFIIGK